MSQGPAKTAAILSTEPTGTELGLVTRPIQSPAEVSAVSESTLLLAALLVEVQLLRRAFQDWSGTEPRGESSPFSQLN